MFVKNYGYMERIYEKDLEIFHSELEKIEIQFPEYLKKGDLKRRCIINNRNNEYNKGDEMGYGILSIEGTVLPPEINNKIREVWNRHMK